jgi:putative peptide zinc metalloprotease protein
LASGSQDVSAVYELLYNPNYTPSTSPSCHIEKLTVDGEPTFVLMKESSAEYYDVDPTTNAIWQLINGSRTVREIYTEAKSFDESLTEKDVRDVIISLAEEGTIESTEPEFQNKRIETPSPFELGINLLEDSSKSLAGLFKVTRRLIKKPELPVAIGIAILGFVLFWGSFVRIFSKPSLFNLAGSPALGFFFYQLIVLLPVYAVHELAHAAMCDYYGGKPRGIGTGLYYLAPFFYCDTSDAWRLPRRARIMISVAGPLSTVVISSFLVFWSYFVSPGYGRDVLQIGAFFGYYGTLLNFSPVIETDGYYILADVLNIPNLRDEAFGFVKRALKRLVRRPVHTVRQSARRRRIIAIYSLVTFAWLAFFGYTTLWLLYVYGTAAYLAVLGLGSVFLGLQAFNLATVGVNLATLGYFGLDLAGFVVMGAVASKNIRMKGVKLETIHDKRVSAFLPVPSFIGRYRASELVEKGRKLARNFSHSFSVTLEPPLCVAALKLGKVDQSLDAMREEMQRVERDFRSLHYDFIKGNPVSNVATPKKRMIAEGLVELASQFPPQERRRASLAVSEFLRKQDEAIAILLQSAFGTVWTLGVSPGDYKRIRREMFPSLIAEDLGLADLPSELEAFKKHIVLGTEAMAQLSSEIEEESREVYKSPELYQLTAFIEPMKSRLVFIGRTDKVEGAVVWIGGLFLYQAWTNYIGEVLADAALGLGSIGLAPSVSLTKREVAGLRDEELALLEEDLARVEGLTATVEEAMSKIESTFESAQNFHETLSSLVSDETFDIGLYRPILSANSKHLEGVRDRIGEFRAEFRKVSQRLVASAAAVREENSRRASSMSARTRGRVRRFLGRVASPNWAVGRPSRTPVFDAQVRLIFATLRPVYNVVMGSDIVL